MVAKRPTLPFEAPEGVLFTLKDLTYSPEQPRKKVPFTVKGKIELFGIPFYAPVWVIATVTYPEKWWEEIIPIIGGPEVREMSMVVGGDFEITFKKGFDREGEFGLAVRVYAGPTVPIDKITLPPFPPVASEEMTFIVAGEVPPEEVGFRNFRIVSYSKNGSAPVTPPGVLELKVGDRLTINLGFDHRDLAVTGKIHAAIWQPRVWDPHDEVLFSEKTFSVPQSEDWKPYPQGIDVVITSAIAPGKYGLYAKIMGITGGDIFTPYLENVITIIGPPEVKFSLGKPVATPNRVTAGQQVTLTCPVTSQSTNPQTATVKVNIYEGSGTAWMAGKLLQTITTVPFVINPGETKQVVVSYTATPYDTVEERDVGVDVWVGGQKITDGQWDNIFYVSAPVISFELSQPRVEPSVAVLGSKVSITCPITSKCTESQTVTVTIEVAEGALGPSPGNLLETQTSPSFAILPGQVKEVVFQHTTKGATSPGNKDITVKVFKGTVLLASTHFDDAFTVVAETIAFTLGQPVVSPPAPYIGQAITITCPVTSGCSKDQTVSVLCEVAEGAWPGSPGTTIETLTSPSLVIKPNETKNVVYNTTAKGSQDRKDITVKIMVAGQVVAQNHFDDAFTITKTAEQYTLSIAVNPYEGGTVTKAPDKATYTKGEYVTLTASPSSGYEFDYWSGDASGYSASISVYMDRNKSVTARFKKVLPPPTQIVNFAVHSKGPPYPTSYWILMHYTMDGQLDFQSQVTPIETNIRVTGVQSAGYLSVFTSNAITGEWRVPQVDSAYFAAVEGGEYTFDINTGIVYVGFI